MQELVSKLEIGSKSVLATTSLTIAEFTGKEHRHVLRDIRSLISKYGEGEIAQPKSGQSNDFNNLDSPPVYQESTYKDSSGISRIMYILDETFTTVLLMGFTGKEAIKWKIAFTKEFQRMRAEIAQPVKPRFVERTVGDMLAKSHKRQQEAHVESRKKFGREIEGDRMRSAHINLSKYTNSAAFGSHVKDCRSVIETEDEQLRLMLAMYISTRKLEDTCDLKEVNQEMTSKLGVPALPTSKDQLKERLSEKANDRLQITNKK